jgi:CubicO group peptidase (beta-lactamase class C family)
MLDIEFFTGLSTLYPSFAPWTTPAYSNVAYQLLSYALEKITGDDYPTTLYKTILTPLNLTNTYYWYANDTVGIVPRNATLAGWNAYLGEGSP